MASTRAAHEETRGITQLTEAEMMAASNSNRKLIAEDGWIFSELPGKGVECVRRYDEAAARPIGQPNLVRHHYPST